MHELTGRIANISFSFEGRPVVTLELFERRNAPAIMNKLLELKGEESLAFKISKHKKKRSLDANAYCFVLIGKIAEKTGIPKTEVYRKAVKEIGGNYDVVCVQNKAVDSLRETWEKNGLGWQTETMDSKIEGCTNIVLYYGSSTYDTETMSRLIDNIVQDCKALGIETKSEVELNSLLEGWGK